MCPFCSILFHSILELERLWNSKICECGLGVLIVQSKPRRENVSSYCTVPRDYLFGLLGESLAERVLLKDCQE